MTHRRKKIRASVSDQSVQSSSIHTAMQTATSAPSNKACTVTLPDSPFLLSVVCH